MLFRSNRRLALYREALDIISTYNLFIQPNGNLIEASESTAKILGYDLEELNTMTLQDLDISLDVNVWQEHWQTLQQQTYVEMLTYHRKKNGESVPIQLTLAYLPQQNVAYAYAVLYTPPDPLSISFESTEADSTAVEDSPSTNQGVMSWRQWKV